MAIHKRASSQQAQAMGRAKREAPMQRPSNAPKRCRPSSAVTTLLLRRAVRHLLAAMAARVCAPCAPIKVQQSTVRCRTRTLTLRQTVTVWGRARRAALVLLRSGTPAYDTRWLHAGRRCPARTHCTCQVPVGSSIREPAFLYTAVAIFAHEPAKYG